MHFLKSLHLKLIETFAGAACLAAVAVSPVSPSHESADGSCAGGAAQEENKAVRLTTVRMGETTRFIVENNEYCEITMTFELATRNLKSDVQFPCTLTFPPRKRSEAFAVEPADPSKGWEFSYTNYYKLGSSLARHDDTVLYGLPYADGSRFKVTQAYGGAFSHKGSNKYAVDWKMPEGTPVHAARGGEVVKVRDDSTRGGPSMSYDKYNNFVLIRHDDGSLGHYCHLLKNSVVVTMGDRISTGQKLARSGNTGYSSGPHLHFCVFKTLDGKTRESVPVKFRTGGDMGTTLTAGRNYQAVPSANGRAFVGTKSASEAKTAAGASGS